MLELCPVWLSGFCKVEIRDHSYGQISFVHLCMLFFAGFVVFIQKEISDVTNQLLDSSLRLLMQLLVQWKTSMNTNTKVCSHHVILRESTHRQGLG